MGALIALLPQILSLMNNPAVVALLPLLQQILQQLGTQAFPGIDPNKAASAGSALFDTEHVKWGQTALNVLGSKVEVDGVYGQGTKAAVSEFQKTHGLVVDGWSGSKTNEALRAALLQGGNGHNG